MDTFFSLDTCEGIRNTKKMSGLHALTAHATARPQSRRKLAATIVAAMVICSGLIAAPPVRAGVTELWIAQSGTWRDRFSWYPPASCSNPDYVGDDDSIIRYAISQASSGTTIVLCEGTYGMSDTLTLGSKNITLVGLSSDETILEGNGNQIVNSNGTVQVLNLTMRNGASDNNGGAIKASQIIARQVNFIDNHADTNGGAMYANNIDLSNVTLQGNSADSRGGSVYGTTVNVSSSLIALNAANYGGAISGGSITVKQSYFEANTASFDGGAISASAVRITASYLTDNYAGDDGGAIAMESGKLSSNVFVGNSSYGFGGAVYVYGDASISRNKFIGNSVEAGWGIVLLNYATARSAIDMVGNSFTGNLLVDSGVVTFLGPRIAGTAIRRVVPANLFKQNTSFKLYCIPYTPDFPWC